jgi:hypothetical protein
MGGDPLLISGLNEQFNIELFAEGLDSKDPKTIPLGSPELWGSLVQLQLAFIRSSDSGRLLLNAIRRDGQGRWVRIVPWAFFKNVPNYQWDHACRAGTKAENITANGHTIAARLQYSPHLFFQGSFCQQTQYHDQTTDRGAAAHEILFHELVHAYRFVSGKHPARNTKATGGLRNYDDAEEFYAVLITNIFISDPSTLIKSGLRRDHQNHTPLEDNLAKSFAFFSSGAQAFTLIDRFCRDHKQFATELAAIRAPFNPLHAYYCDPVRARMLSNNRMAKTRDLIGRLPDTIAADFAHDLTAPLRLILDRL